MIKNILYSLFIHFLLFSAIYFAFVKKDQKEIETEQEVLVSVISIDSKGVPPINEQMEKLQRGASYPAVTDNDVKGVILNFPKSLEVQQTIVRQLDALRAETQRLEAVYQQKLADLEELKKSILQKAFAGELTYKSIAL